MADTLADIDTQPATRQRKRKPLPKKKDETKRPPGKRVRANSDIASLLGVLLPVILTVIGVYFLYWNNSSTTSSNDGSSPKSSSPEPLPAEDAPFEVVDLPGRGKGAIASRDIAQGERIITERPLFVVPLEVREDPVALLRRQLDNLSQAQEDAYWALSHHAPSDKPVDIDGYHDGKVLSIFQTNAINAGPGRVGIFPRTARLNHGCVSAFNAIYSWREDEQILVTHVLKPISKGQEILTVYFRSRQPRSDRQSYLYNHYHFACTCSHCTLPRHLVGKSDGRIAKINGNYEKFAKWEQGVITGNEAAQLAQEIWRLGNDEGYWSERGQLAADMALVAAAHQDEKATRAWATLAEQWFGYELGADSQQVRLLKSVIADPRTHAHWGSRTPMTIELPAKDIR